MTKSNKKAFLFTILYFLLLGTFTINNIEAQNKNIDSLLTLLKRDQEDSSKINILNNLFLQYEYIDTKKAKESLNKALELSHKINYKKGLAATYLHLGFLAENNGNYPEALKNYFACLKVAEAMNDKKAIAGAYCNIGIIYQYKGNYPEALKNHFAYLKIAEAIGDKKSISVAYTNIGVIYQYQNNYSEALKNYFASLKIAEVMEDKRSIAHLYNNIGGVYGSQGNYPEALKNFLASLKIKEAINNKAGIPPSYNNIGTIYSHQGNYPEALKNHFAALKIAEAIGNKADVSISYYNIGNVFIKQKHYTEAEKYLTKAKELSKKIGLKKSLMDTYNSLTELDSAMGNYKGAYENHKHYILYRDSLDNEETRKKIVESQMTYEFEKKEAVTKAEQEKRDLETQWQLQKKNQMIYILAGMGLLLILATGLIFSFYRQNKLRAKQQNMELQQKLLRTQMNPHFIFNALMSIQSFIYENEPKEAGMYLSRFAKLMRMILENSNEEYIPLKKELNTLENYLELQKLRFENKFDYAIETAPELNIETVLIPPMLTQPFIENALEHGLRYIDIKGFIKVLFGFNKENITIEVQDNGIGREKSAEIKKESESSHRSMAMDISKERLFILNKGHKRKITLDIYDLKDENDNPTGTKVVFTIPFKEIDA